MNLCARHRSEFSQLGPQRIPSDGDDRGYAFHAKPHCRRIIAGLEGTRCRKLIVAGEHRAIGADDKGGIPPCAVTTMFHADHHRDAVLASSPLESFERTFRDRSLRKHNDVGVFRTGLANHRLQIGKIAGHLRGGEGDVRLRGLQRLQGRRLDGLTAVQLHSRLPKWAEAPDGSRGPAPRHVSPG